MGIVELGGGYNSADLTQYFKGLGISSPKITDVAVDGGSNSPTGDPNGPDGEVELDIEVVGAVAPCGGNRDVLHDEHGPRVSRRFDYRDS